MKTMKKILACALAVMLVLALTACSAKCAHCDKRVKGDGYERDGKVYCDKQCSDDAAFQDKLESYMPDENDSNSGNSGNGGNEADPGDEGDEIPELEEDPLPEELPEEIIPGGNDIIGEGGELDD